MIYIGIDIAKNTHYAAAMSSDGEILIEAFPFLNSHDGFQLFLSKIQHLDKNQLLIGLESTAHYGNNLISFLSSLHFKISVINPIETAALRKSNIRKTKTDKVDAFLIIKALMLKSSSLIHTQSCSNISDLKELCLARQNLVLLRSRAKIQLANYVDQLFPELNSFFKSGLHINVSHQLLKKHSNPEDIKDLHLTYLSNLLSKASRGRYTKSHAIRLRELAQNSIGIKNHYLSVRIKHNIAQIELYTKQIKEIEANIIILMDSLNSKIMTIPGIGYVNGAMILSVVEDINRFTKPCQILAYARLDPSTMQSGNFIARTTRMSKRGSSMLRYALINASHNVVKNNETFKQYYDLKRSQGKSHYNALGHVSHKLVRVIFILLTRNIEFNLN